MRHKTVSFHFELINWFCLQYCLVLSNWPATPTLPLPDYKLGRKYQSALPIKLAYIHTPTGVTLWFAQFKIATNFQIKKKLWLWIGIDLDVNFPKTNYGCQYILVISDTFAKWVEFSSTCWKWKQAEKLGTFCTLCYKEWKHKSAIVQKIKVKRKGCKGYDNVCEK